MIEKWQVFEPRVKGLIKTLGTRGKEIKVETIMDIITTGQDIEIESEIMMEIGDEKMIIKRRAVLMFHQGTVILTTEIHEWKPFLPNCLKDQKTKKIA